MKTTQLGEEDPCEVQLYDYENVLFQFRENLMQILV